MDKKGILISIDGMRADGVQVCGNPYVEELKKIGSYTFNARTVFPSVTLPCHMSLFHSVTPERHGITTNTYVPQVRPINGLFEQINMSGKRSAMYYGWEPLRDISCPKSLVAAEYINAYSFEHTDAMLTDSAINYVKKAKPDFVFLYMVETDEKGGHDNGWMSTEYLGYISTAIDQVERVYREVGNEYTILVTADHGGHDRAHGTDLDEDMTIPMFFIGDEFTPGKEWNDEISLLELAPTIADVMGIPLSSDWEGRSLLK